MLKLIRKFRIVANQLLIVSAFAAILCGTLTAQNSTESLTKPTATPIPEPTIATVTISQEDADRCANNTRELIAAREEIKAYVDEIKSRDDRDANVEKLIAGYEKLLAQMDRVIAAQDSLSTDKNSLIKEQTELIKTLIKMRQKKDPLFFSILKVVAGFLTGLAF